MIDVLAMVAHPDDAELLCAGALLRAADLGQRTGILDLTAGEAGSAGTRAGRAVERERASAILGLAERRSADLPDGAVENTPAVRLQIAALLRELRPRVVILHWPEARHPDHRAAAELGRDACFIAGMHRAAAPGEAHRPVKILHALTYQEHAPKPTFVVDISAQMERKLDAIFAYDSQFAGKQRMGDVMGGERPLRDQILAHHAHYGSLIRRPYGEPYYTRETMRVDDLMTLEAASM
ncbi:MAG TPA: bacillithiol biosynthesis deacetylase BshB1 [Longimicrobiales bacterium]|nr:bacillithiol biosynthesis deacetylase BshB1 [Longimicrobiales bacterium]